MIVKKEIILIILITFIICFSYVFWLFGAQILKDPSILATFSLIEVGVIILSYVLYLTGIILISSIPFTLWLKYILVIISSLPILFFPFSLITNIILIIIFDTVLVIFEILIRKEILLLTRFDLYHIFANKLTYITGMVSIILALQTYYSSIQYLDNLTLKIPNSFLTQAINLSSPFIKTQLEEQQATLRDNLLTQLKTQIPFTQTLTNNELDSLLNGDLTPKVIGEFQKMGISSSQAQEFVNSISTEFKKLTGTNLIDPIDLSPDQMQPFLVEIQKSLEKTLNSLLDNNKSAVSMIISSTIIIFLNFFGFIIKILSLLLANLCIRFLLKLGLINKVYVDVPVERIGITS